MELPYFFLFERTTLNRISLFFIFFLFILLFHEQLYHNKIPKKCSEKIKPRKKEEKKKDFLMKKIEETESSKHIQDSRNNQPIKTEVNIPSEYCFLLF